MKIEWLNDELTRAKIVRGWFRKRYAIVQYCNGCWRFEFDNGELERGSSTSAYTDGRLSGARDRVRTKRHRELRKRAAEQTAREARETEDRIWRPVQKLPKARLLKG